MRQRIEGHSALQLGGRIAELIRNKRVRRFVKRQADDDARQDQQLGIKPLSDGHMIFHHGLHSHDDQQDQDDRIDISKKIRDFFSHTHISFRLILSLYHISLYKKSEGRVKFLRKFRLCAVGNFNDLLRFHTRF